MSFRTELYKGFSEFLKMLQRDHELDVLLMPYAEYSLQFYVTYRDELYKGLLSEGSPLANAFCELGIDETRDQFMIFIDAFYLHWHTQDESIS